MKIAVLVKSAVDEAELRADQSGRPVLKGAATKMSSFDANGVEEAVRQKEANGGTVTAVTLGGAEARKVLKEAIAMGATDGVHVVAEPTALPDTIATAFCLAQAVKRVGAVDLVVCSEGASDTYQGQVGAMVAEFLGMPFLSYVRKLETSGGRVKCEQANEGGAKSLDASLPAVVSVVSEANVPRYPTLLQVMAAGKKPVEEVPLSSLQEAGCPQTGVEVLEVSVQPSSRKRLLLDGTPEEAARKLVEALRKEGVA